MYDRSNSRRERRPSSRALRGGRRGGSGAGRGIGRGGVGSGGIGVQNAPVNAPTGPAGRGQYVSRGSFNAGAHAGRGYQGQGGVQEQGVDQAWGGGQGRGGHQSQHAATSRTTSQKPPNKNSPPLDPATFRPPTDYIDQTTVGSAGIRAKYGDCLWCREPKGNGHLDFNGCSMFEDCGFCERGEAHRGLPCPLLYCSDSWWTDHFGKTPPNVQVRPSEQQREELVQMDPFFANFPVPIHLQSIEGQKRKREEDADEVALLKVQLDTMTRLKSEEKQKSNEQKMQRLKAEVEAAAARHDIAEKVRSHEKMAEQMRHLLASRQTVEDKLRDLSVKASTRDSDIMRAKQVDSDHVLASARAEWEKEKQVAVQTAKDETVEHIRRRVVDVQRTSNIEHLRRLAEAERQKATQATADAEQLEAQAAALEEEATAARALMGGEEGNNNEQGLIMPPLKEEE